MPIRHGFAHARTPRGSSPLSTSAPLAPRQRPPPRPIGSRQQRARTKAHEQQGPQPRPRLPRTCASPCRTGKRGRPGRGGGGGRRGGGGGEKSKRKGKTVSGGGHDRELCESDFFCEKGMAWQELTVGSQAGDSPRSPKPTSSALRRQALYLGTHERTAHSVRASPGGEDAHGAASAFIAQAT